MAMAPATAQIPEAYSDLVERPITVSLATLLPSGQPQVTPVWVGYDGTYLIVNTVKDRRKFKDMEANPRVTVLAVDPENPYRYMEVRGRVVRTSEQGADENIDKLAKKYLGVDKYPFSAPGEQRVMCYIEPEHVEAQG